MWLQCSECCSSRFSEVNPWGFDPGEGETKAGLDWTGPEAEHLPAVCYTLHHLVWGNAQGWQFDSSFLLLVPKCLLSRCVCVCVHQVIIKKSSVCLYPFLVKLHKREPVHCFYLTQCHWHQSVGNKRKNAKVCVCEGESRRERNCWAGLGCLIAWTHLNPRTQRNHPTKTAFLNHSCSCMFEPFVLSCWNFGC